MQAFKLKSQVSSLVCLICSQEQNGGGFSNILNVDRQPESRPEDCQQLQCCLLCEQIKAEEASVFVYPIEKHADRGDFRGRGPKD